MADGSTYSSSVKTDPWDRAKMAAVWMRDKFASWFATAWLYIILWTVVAIDFAVLLYLDGTFSRNLAEGAPIDPLSFQAMGWCYRLFAAAFLMAAARCVHKDIPGKWTYRLLGIFASVIVCLHAFGFGFEALADRRDQAMATRAVVEQKAVNNDDVVNELRGQQDRIREDLVKRLEPINSEIYELDNDGIAASDKRSDALRERRTNLEDEAQAKIDKIDDQIIMLVVDSGGNKIDAAKVEAEAKPWSAIFVGIAQLFTWSKDPTDWAIYLSAIIFIIFWVLLGESLVIFLPERIYEMHLADARTGGGRTVTINGEEYDEDWLANAAQHRENFEEGTKRGKSTRRRKRKISDMTSYYRGRIDHLIDLREDGMPLMDALSEMNWTVDDFKRETAHLLSEAESEVIFAEDEPEEDEDDADVSERA